MGADAMPAELVLELVRSQIEAHRAERAPRLTQGALTFELIGADGLTDHHTVYIEPDAVTLRTGVPPLERPGPWACLTGTPADLEAITRGRRSDLTVDGDAKLLELVSRCFADPASVLGVRGTPR